MVRTNSHFDLILNPIFKITGRRPWSYIYNLYKWKMIKKYLELDLFNNGELKGNYGKRLDERIIEYPWLFSRLPKENGTILDAGSALNYELLLNWPSIKSKTLFISTLGPEKNCFWMKGISYIYEDLRTTCYKEEYFDWVVCISTLEHIGLDNTTFYTDDPLKKENMPSAYLLAINEIHRILKPGGVLFLTVPFGQYANHKWWQVFDAEMIDNIISTFNPSSVIETHFRYSNKIWYKSNRKLSKDATCSNILKNNEIISDFSSFSRAVICLELKK